MSARGQETKDEAEATPYAAESPEASLAVTEVIQCCLRRSDKVVWLICRKTDEIVWVDEMRHETPFSILVYGSNDALQVLIH